MKPYCGMSVCNTTQKSSRAAHSALASQPNTLRQQTTLIGLFKNFLFFFFFLSPGEALLWYVSMQHHTEVIEGCSLSFSFTTKYPPPTDYFNRLVQELSLVDRTERDRLYESVGAAKVDFIDSCSLFESDGQTYILWGYILLLTWITTVCGWVGSTGENCLGCMCIDPIVVYEIVFIKMMHGTYAIS